MNRLGEIKKEINSKYMKHHAKSCGFVDLLDMAKWLVKRVEGIAKALDQIETIGNDAEQMQGIASKELAKLEEG